MDDGKTADAHKFCAEVSVELNDGCVRHLQMGKTHPRASGRYRQPALRTSKLDFCALKIAHLV